MRAVPLGQDNVDSYMPTLNVTPGATLRIYNRRLDDMIRMAYNKGEVAAPVSVGSTTSGINTSGVAPKQNVPR